MASRPPETRGTYQFTTSDGRVYEVQADNEAQAQRLANFVEERIAAGDVNATGGTPPDNARREEASRPLASLHIGLPFGGPDGPGLDLSTDMFGNAVRNFQHGGALNWDDEIASFVDAIPGGRNIRQVLPVYGGGLGPAAVFDPASQSALTDPDGFWGAFHSNMAAHAAQRAQDEERHPIVAHGAQIGGAIASMAGPGGVAANVAERLLPRAAIPLAMRAEAAMIGAPVRTALARGTVAGGGIGTVAGAGAGEGNRAQSAALGGLTGAGAGALLDTGVSALVPAIGRYASALFGRVPHEEAMTQILQSLRRDGFDLTRPANVQALRTELARFSGRPVSLADIGAATRARAGVGLRSPSDVQQQSIDQVLSRSQGSGVRLRRDVLDNVAPRTDVHALDEQLVAQRASEAERLRQQALFEGGAAPPAEASRSYSDMPAGNPDDVARLRDRWNQFPYHSDAIVNTPQGRGTVFASSVDNAAEGVPASGTVIVKLDDGNMVNIPASDVRSAWAAPRLQSVTPQTADTFAPVAAGSGGPVSAVGSGGLQTRVVSDPQLIALMQHPNMQRALPAALTRSRNELLLNQATGQPTEHLGTEVLTAEQLQNIMDISHGGMLDMRTLDTVKRYLDDEVGNLYRRGQGNTFTVGEAHQVQALRDALRNRMREVNPEYGTYLDQYSGSSDMIDSLEAGRSFRNLDPEEITAGQVGRSTAAQELYRVGAARDLTDTISETTDGRNPATRLLNSDEERAQLDALGLQPGAADRLNTAVGQERQMNLLPAEMAGSATDARAAARADADITPSIPYISGNPVNWAGAGARWIANHFGTQRLAGVNAEVLPRLLETDRAAMDAIIDELEQHGSAQLAATLRRNQRGSRVSRGFAATIGAPVALPQEDYNGR